VLYCVPNPPPPPNSQLLGRDVRFARGYIGRRCANVQGHIGSAVRRQAAENLTPLFQPVTDGSSTWRGRRETHRIIVTRLLDLILICSCVIVQHTRDVDYSSKSKFSLIANSFNQKTSLLSRLCSCVSSGLFCTELFAHTRV
jgi:hypothetical protein